MFLSHKPDDDPRIGQTKHREFPKDEYISETLTKRGRKKKVRKIMHHLKTAYPVFFIKT